MRNITLPVLAILTGLGMTGACGGDESDPVTNNSTGGSGGTSTGGTGGTGGSSSGGTGGGMASCTNTGDEGLDASEAGIPGSTGVYSYGDGMSTRCLTSEGGNQACLAGLGADATSAYTYWGTGIGVELASGSTPWNATAAGVAQVRFTIAGVSPSAPVRMGITMANTTDVEFQEQGFVDATGAGDAPAGDENDITADATITVKFDDMKLPAWTDFDGDATTDDQTLYSFDPTSLHSLQFQLVTAPNTTRPYDFCVSDIAWLDEDGNVVDLPVGGGSGGAGGAAGAGGQGGAEAN